MPTRGCRARSVHCATSAQCAQREKCPLAAPGACDNTRNGRQRDSAPPAEYHLWPSQRSASQQFQRSRANEGHLLTDFHKRFQVRPFLRRQRALRIPIHQFLEMLICLGGELQLADGFHPIERRSNRRHRYCLWNLAPVWIIIPQPPSGREPGIRAEMR